MSEFERVGSVDDFEESKPRLFRFGQEEVVVVRVGESFYAFTNDCAHAGAPLVDGYVAGCEIVCAYHSWSFDLATGVEGRGGAGIETYAVRVEDGFVSVERHERGADWRPPHLRFVSVH